MLKYGYGLRQNGQTLTSSETEGARGISDRLAPVALVGCPVYQKRLLVFRAVLTESLNEA